MNSKKIVMFTILIGLFVTGVALAARPYNGPFIVMDSKGKVNGCTNEPKPCYGRDLVIENPLFRFVLVQFDCGSMMFNSPVVEISPRVKMTFQITSDQPGSMSEGQCKIKFWKVKGMVL